MIADMLESIYGITSALMKARGHGIGWYDSATYEWRFQRLGSRDEVRAAIGMNAFFDALRIWELEHAAKVKP